ncbi:hypothetical protein DYB32_009876, partial [Aphanomyces invadans]
MAPPTLAARLEQQARDPIDVLRVRLKDVSETSVLNTQQLLEIKTDYLHRAESTKGQLDGFVQAQIDEIERASTLLSFDDSIAKVSLSLRNMGASCQRMREELGDDGVASEVSIARRNLKDLHTQMQFYEDLPATLAEMEQTLQVNLGQLVSVFSKYLIMDDWRQKMLLQVILRILDGTWSIVVNCIEMVQFDRKRLVDAFQIVEHLEKRRRKRVDANKLYLDHSLQPISESAAPSMFHMCRDQLATSLQARVADYFVHPPDQAFAQAFNGMLNNASNLLVDLEYVDRDVASCFPAAIDAVQVFVASYNTALEVQVARYRSGTVSAILDQNANLVMKLYLDGIQEQIHTWVTNIYNRDEEPVVGPSGELHSTRPNDIMNILSSQITIAQEWLSGGLLAR